jgi:membrane dipeptidase
MFILDAHQDIAYNTLCYQRDYRVSALKKRQHEQGTAVPQANGLAMLGLPEALAGRVALIFATIFVAPKGEEDGLWDRVSYKTPRQAYEMGMTQLDVYRRLTDMDDRLMLVTTQADLDAVLATWTPDKDIKSRKQGLVLLMENADPILEPRQFEEWYEQGVRLVGPAWQATRYSAGTGAPGGLTALGRELLEVMQSFNAILDLSHMAEAAYLEALERYEGIVIASHSNPRRFCDRDRHLNDEMIRLLAERDGVIGTVLPNYFLDGTWQRRDGKRAVTLQRVVEIIDYICQLTGSAAHVGIGSDFDGGFGAESVPQEFDTVADLWQIKQALADRGFGADDVKAILHGNMLRKLREGLA